LNDLVFLDHEILVHLFGIQCFLAERLLDGLLGIQAILQVECLLLESLKVVLEFANGLLLLRNVSIILLVIF
jgi:hypothetical protein